MTPIVLGQGLIVMPAKAGIQKPRSVTMDRPVKPGDDTEGVSEAGVIRLAPYIAASCLLLMAALAASAEERYAYVTVAGAPGDGEEALAASLSRKLASIGLAPASAFQANVYEVQGTVRVAPSSKGKESVTIVWVVLDPDGQQLGVVRQMRDVRKGSLDKRWGPAADAAAEAAAADIAALLPR